MNRIVLALFGLLSMVGVAGAQPDEIRTELRNLREDVQQLLDEVKEINGRKRWYVSPCGEDDNPGTRAEPLKTTAVAFERVKPGETIYILGRCQPTKAVECDECCRFCSSARAVDDKPKHAQWETERSEHNCFCGGTR